jgi:gluconate 2-dehydrogenase gamma chain
MDPTVKAPAETRSHAFNEFEFAVLTAVADRIFPPTDTPGAVEIGAVIYIEIALGGDYAQSLSLYRAGLQAINAEARRKFARDFAELNGSEQDAILAEFESGSISGFEQAAEFFETVRYHVLEGVFCEPQYGGNKDMIGWRIVEFPGQQPGYPDAYINRRVDLAPVAVDYGKKGKRQ